MRSLTLASACGLDRGDSDKSRMLCASLSGGEGGRLPNCQRALAARITLALTSPLARQGHAPKALPARATQKVSESKRFL